MTRVTFDGDVTFEQNSPRIAAFVELVYEKLRGHCEYLNFEEINELVLATSALAEFWSQLYYPVEPSSEDST